MRRKLIAAGITAGLIISGGAAYVWQAECECPACIGIICVPWPFCGACPQPAPETPHWPRPKPELEPPPR